MKPFMLMLMGWHLAAAGLQAQVSVEVILDQEKFLQEQSLPVKVRITNRAGQPLHLGKEADWINFHVESVEENVVRRRAPVKVDGEFTLDSSKMAMREVDLLPFFELPTGRYRITASVRLKDWNREILSDPEKFEIVRGTKLWQQTVGVPQPSGPPESRTYMLLQASYLDQLYLYVRITDLAELQIYRVLPIGRLLSFSRPEAQIDRNSSLHLLFQTGPRDFTYAVVDPYGRFQFRHRYQYTTSRPSLKSHPDGTIGVQGGLRKLTRFDIPPPTLKPKIAPPPDDASPAAP